VGVRYGFIEGLTQSWSAHELGFSLPFTKLTEAGLKLKLPSFMKESGVHFSIGNLFTGRPVTGQVMVVLLGGKI